MTNKILSFLTLIHRWGGLIGGWFCFVVAITGTISVYDLEINQWMQPELAKYTYSSTISEQSLQTAYQIWQENTEKKRLSFIILPSERYPLIQVSYYQWVWMHWKNIDPISGMVLPTQETVGGYFFDDLHNNLLMGRPVGDIMIILLAVLFFIFILSGFIIHLKHLLKEIFKVRPRASALRFMLDIHLGIGVFFFPFLLIMVVSGFLFYAPSYLSFLNLPPNHYVKKPYKNNEDTAGYSRKSLFSLVQEAKVNFHSMPGFIVITPKQIHVVQSDADQLAILRNYIQLDRSSEQVSLQINQSTTVRYLVNLIYGLHLARTGGDSLRFIYFITGIGSSILIATGLVFFSNKRRHFNPKHISARLSIFYKIVDGVHVCVIMGMLLALLSVFWVNMIFPVTSIEKSFWEVTCFCIVLLLSLLEGIIYSFYSNIMHAWRHQILLFAWLCIFLPLIKMIIYPQIFFALLDGKLLYLAISLVFICIGVAFLVLYLNLKRKTIVAT